MWKHCDYYCRFYFTTAVLLDNIRFSLFLVFFFLLRVKCREVFKCRTTAFSGGEGLLRGSSHFQFAMFCKRILIKNVKKKKWWGGEGEKKTTNKIPQPIAVLAPVAGDLI